MQTCFIFSFLSFVLALPAALAEGNFSKSCLPAGRRQNQYLDGGLYLSATCRSIDGASIQSWLQLSPCVRNAAAGYQLTECKIEIDVKGDAILDCYKQHGSDNSTRAPIKINLGNYIKSLQRTNRGQVG